MPVSIADTVFAIAGLLTVAMVAAGLLRRLPIPYTVVLVLIGMGIGATMEHVPALASLEALELSPDLVFFVFLPALIFESGLNLDARQLARDLAPVLALAVPALLVSAAIVGVGAHLALGLGLGAALVFGALISATDPVAVVALFKELGAPLRLTTLVEGESLLNDATAVVLVTILVTLVAGPASVDAATLSLAALRFVWVFFGGAVVGAIFGFVFSELVHRLRSEPAEVAMLSLAAAYASFIAGEHLLHVSGVMATAAAAVTIGSYGATRIRAASAHTMSDTWELVAGIANSLLFILVGIAVDASGVARHAVPVLVAAALVHAARAGVVYTMAPLTARLFGLPRITRGVQHIMFWGGLKGGLAIAVALSVPLDMPGRDVILQLTLGVVMFTLLVNAPTIRPLMSRLGLDRLTPYERAELDELLDQARREANAELGTLRDAGLVTRASERRIMRGISRALAGERVSVTGEQRARAAYLEMLRVELETLRALFDLGLVSHYTYLDMRNTLQQEREAQIRDESRDEGRGEPLAERVNPFQRFESALVARLREHDRAARVLARYQGLRLAHRVRRDMAGVLTSQAAIARLEGLAEIDPAHRHRLEREYRERLDKRARRISSLRQEFHDFFEHIESTVGTRVALAAALRAATRAREHGGLGAKSFARLERAVGCALDALPRHPGELSALSHHDLVATVPLLAGLPEAVTAAITDSAQVVTFLPGDVIVGEAEHGDALYVVVAGRVEVLRGEGADAEHVTTLGTGDFFGEMALLGDSVRKATVRAVDTTNVLRIARDDVLQIAEQRPEVGERLREARAARGDGS